MSRKALMLTFLAVLALHAGLFLLVMNRPVIPPEWLRRTAPPEPTFTHGEAHYTDPQTGEVMQVQEFTVPARLAPATKPVNGDW